MSKDATAATPVLRDLEARDRAQIERIDALHRGRVAKHYWASVFERFGTHDAGGSSVGVAAEIDGDLVGYLLGEIRAFEFGSEPCGWIFAVGVDPARTRGDIGSRLLDEACRRFRQLGIGTVRTMVSRNDVRVLSFFRSSGFVGGSFVQLELDLEDAS